MAEIAANKLIDKVEGVENTDYPQNIGCELKYRASTEGWKPQPLTDSELQLVEV